MPFSFLLGFLRSLFQGGGASIKAVCVNCTNCIKEGLAPHRQRPWRVNDDSSKLTQTEINIAIGDKAPEAYFAELAAQCSGGEKKYGGIDGLDEIRANLRANCVPERLLDGDVPAFDDYLEERRKLMAAKIREYFWKR